MKILNDEIKRIRGEEVEEETNEPPLLNIATHINDDYVSENELKIEIHKLISSIDSYDKLKTVKEEIEDRFGKIDYEMDIYMHEEWFDKIARRAGVIKVNQTKTSVEIIFNVEVSKTINGEKLFISAYNISPYFKFNYHNKCLGVSLATSNLPKHYIFYLIKLINENF